MNEYLDKFIFEDLIAGDDRNYIIECNESVRKIEIPVLEDSSYYLG